MDRVEMEIQGCRPALGSSRCKQGERRQAFPKRVSPAIQSVNIAVIVGSGHLDVLRPIGWQIVGLRFDAFTSNDLPPIAQLHHAVVSRRNNRSYGKFLIKWPEEWGIPDTELRREEVNALELKASTELWFVLRVFAVGYEDFAVIFGCNGKPCIRQTLEGAEQDASMMKLWEVTVDSQSRSEFRGFPWPGKTATQRRLPSLEWCKAHQHESPQGIKRKWDEQFL